MPKVNDVIEVHEKDDVWVDGSIIAVNGGEITIALKQRGTPLTQRRVSDEGITWKQKEEDPG